MTDEEIAVTLTDHDNQIKSLKHRMDKSEKRDEALVELTISIKTLAVNMENMAKEQQRQGERLERLEDVPAEDFKHYKRLIVGAIISAVLGALIGAAITLIIK